MDDAALIAKARSVLRWRQLSEDCSASEVSAALESISGNVFVGVSISAACGVGACAEYAAVAQMVTAGENQIRKIVAVASDGKIIPPCGRCRELLYQVDRRNLRTQIILDGGKLVTLASLLPYPWQDAWTERSSR